MSEIKWVFLDMGSTLVDESDVYESRCNYVISAKGLEHDEFIEKVHHAAKVRDYIIGEFCSILMLSQLPQKQGMKSRI